MSALSAGARGVVAKVSDSQAVVVYVPDSGDPLRSVGGITLLERILRQLSEIDNIRRILVIKPETVSLSSPSLRIRKDVAYRNVRSGNFWQMLREAREEVEGHFIAVAADFLIDQRLLVWLLAQSRSVMLVGPQGGAAEPVARLTRAGLDADTPEGADVGIVSVLALPSYWEAMHGDVPLHLHRVTNEEEAETGLKILLDYVQRRTLELPARYFDPPFENWLVRHLAGTRITANQVTLVTTLLGLVVAALYYVGWLRAGVLLAILVEVLDGVDGKLARITRTTSRAGELEHIADFFYENACYLALGFYLSGNGFSHAWIAAMLMVFFDLSDTLAYAIVDLKFGLSLDNVSPRLARFRLIAGRRNIYNWLFLPGFFLGAPAYMFYSAAIWAGITAAVHVGWVISEVPLRGGTASSTSQASIRLAGR